MTNNSDNNSFDGLPPQIAAAVMRGDLATFFRMVVWRVLKPHERLLWAPFMDLLCAYLQAVAEGRINRLIITVPPRFGKSLAGSVALPAFFLGHNPAAEVMCVSYAQELARQFGELTRRVMASSEYQALFNVRLVSNKASPTLLKTTEGGSRRATSIDGSATGMGAHLMVFDDPQKPGEMLSDAIRRSTNSAYENTFISRQNESMLAALPTMPCLIQKDWLAERQWRSERQGRKGRCGAANGSTVTLITALPDYGMSSTLPTAWRLSMYR